MKSLERRAAVAALVDSSGELVRIANRERGVVLWTLSGDRRAAGYVGFMASDERRSQNECALAVSFRLGRLLAGEAGGVSPIGRPLKIGRREYVVRAIGDSIGKAWDLQAWSTLPADSTCGILHASALFVRGAENPADTSELPVVVAQLKRWATKWSADQRGQLSVSAPDLVAERGVRKRLSALRAVLLGFSVIALAISTICIVVVQLSSLYQRTRELAVRRAVGARSIDIRNQVLAECATFALLGVIGGEVVAWMCCATVLRIAKYWSGQPLELVASPTAVLLPLGTTIAALLLAGLLPATRAARLSPTDGLRIEL